MLQTLNLIHSKVALSSGNTWISRSQNHLTERHLSEYFSSTFIILTVQIIQAGFS